MGGFFVPLIFAGAAGLIFPVFLFVDLYADIFENRAWFCVSLFHKIKLFGGYAQIRKEGFVFHFTKKKAVFLPFSDLTSARKQFEVTKGFQLWRYHQTVETGGADAPRGIALAASMRLAACAAGSVLQERHGFLSLKSSLLLHEAPCLKITVRAALILNGLVLLTALTKKLLEGIIEWTKNKNSTVSWKKLQKNLRDS